jgi:cob(I)alamin adenosyltransferase
MSLSTPLFRSLLAARSLLLSPSKSASTTTTAFRQFASLAMDMASIGEEHLVLENKESSNGVKALLEKATRTMSIPKLPVPETASPPEIVDVEDLHMQALQLQQSSYVDPATGFTVFTELLHLKRGTCCGNQCRHCPYGLENVPQKVKNAMMEEAGSLPVAICRSGDKVRAQALVQAIQDGNLDAILNVSRAAHTTTTDSSATSTAAASVPTTTTAAMSYSSTSVASKNVPYTRKGDTGTSQLGTGERRSKCDCNFEALGTVDELCSFVGVAHSHLLLPSEHDYGLLPERLLDVMSRLFDLGSHVAKPRMQQASSETKKDDGSPPTFQPNGIGDGFDADHIDALEEWINEMTEELPELTSFILPTGAKGAAQLHVARTVCRRAERRLVPLVVEEATCDPNALRYLNRLSDFFFVAARWVNYCEGQEEIVYRRESTETKQRERVHRSLH